MSKRMADDKYLDSLFERVEALEAVDDFDKYVLATDADFSGVSNQYFRYTGTDDYVIVPKIIKGIEITSVHSMFSQNEGASKIKGVAFEKNNAIIHAFSMFKKSSFDELELKYLDTTLIERMDEMFEEVIIEKLDVSFFNLENTSNITKMFYNAEIDELNILFFDTSNITNMSQMFRLFKTNSLNLSSFNTSNVTTVNLMFGGSEIDELNLSSFTHESISNKGSMFASCDISVIYFKDALELSYFSDQTLMPPTVDLQIK